MTASRYLYLVRHGATTESGELSDEGMRQAILTGVRLREAHLDAIYHGPLPRAARTAELIATEAGNVPATCTDMAGDYVPHRPSLDVMPAAYASFFEHCGDPKDGPSNAAGALDRFTSPVERDTAELLVTHNFLVSWLVTKSLDIPPERWPGFNQCNCGITVIRYQNGHPPSLLMHNELSHLPPELRWTGFPPDMCAV